MTTHLKDIVCPTCKKKGTWTKENPCRPFCSERCKLIDLGDWAAEKHKIPGENVPEDNESDDSNQDG